MRFKITSLPSFLLSILFVQNYVPTVFENYTASFEIDTQRIELSLWDTSGKRVIGPRGARGGFPAAPGCVVGLGTSRQAHSRPSSARHQRSAPFR